MNTRPTHPLLLLFLLALPALAFSQASEATRAAAAALDDLRQGRKAYNLSSGDVGELEITDNYASASGVRHVYVRQRYRGLPVYNAQAIVHLRGETVRSRTVDFVADLAAGVNTTEPALDATAAVAAAGAELSTGTFGRPLPLGRDGGDHLFRWPGVATGEIRSTLVLLPVAPGQTRLAYRTYLEQANTADYWILLTDATDGRELRRTNLTRYCSFGHTHGSGASCAPARPAAPARSVTTATGAAAADGAKYRVFPFGTEAPNSGVRQLVESPADPTYSPFGWHDTNGEEGPEFTITRGNNVHAYLDTEDNDEETRGLARADGGDSLVFDFYFEDGAPVDTLQRAALTQVFYLSNRMHDFAAAHGFDEAAGNFQRENYTGEGRDRDDLRAEAQDGSGTNNANFSTPPEGSRPRMQMFIWVNSPPSVMTVDAPSSLAGPRNTGTAAFGPPVDSIPLTGSVAIARDETNDPELLCEAADLTVDLNGRVALITRGDCFFQDKVANAQDAGAIAAIICNPENNVFTMGSGNNREVTIPSVMLTENDCIPLRRAIADGEEVTVTFRAEDFPPPVDSDFDNGVIAHEFGHGISTRLVGGPRNSGCLTNFEQMGEGWSDFYALATSPKTLLDAPDGSEARGIGTYATSQEPNGGGIRRKPYSTDLTTNDYTYDDIVTSNRDHQLGEIWGTVLWDLYWAMVEDHGFDDDLINGTGGNNLAVRLVTEGLKYTRCDPGVLDGRDGILQADFEEFDGANTCRIWEVFARRGMGFSARQGSSDSPGDNRNAFDTDPACSNAVQLTKTSDVDRVAPGERVTIDLELLNWRSKTATGLTVTDVVPEGMTIDAASVRGTSDFTIDGNTIVLRVDELEPEDDKTLRYEVTTSPDRSSTVLFEDGAEDEDDNVEIFALDGDVIWEITERGVFRGDKAFFVAGSGESSQEQVLQFFEPFEIEGDNPALRFFTKYDTEAGFDAGLVEVSLDGENWLPIDDRMIRNGYRGEIARATFARSGLNGFWGDSDLWYDNYTNGYAEIIADLSVYSGEELFVRFRFGTDPDDASRGWWVDDVQLIDLVNYEFTATLTSDQGDATTAELGNAGIVVIGDFTSNVTDPQLGRTEVSVFPNPASEVANVRISSERAGVATVGVYAGDGRSVFRQSVQLLPGKTTVPVATAGLPTGVYTVRVSGSRDLATEKLVIR